MDRFRKVFRMMVMDSAQGLQYCKHCIACGCSFKMIPILTRKHYFKVLKEQEDRFKEESLMMVMEVPDHPQNEVSPRSTHLMHHITKSSHLDEKQKTESKNALATSYFGAPFRIHTTYHIIGKYHITSHHKHLCFGFYCKI